MVAAAGYIAVAPDLSGWARNGGRTKGFSEGSVTEAVSFSPDCDRGLKRRVRLRLKLPASNGKHLSRDSAGAAGNPFVATNRVKLAAAFVFATARKVLE
jgi:hypothetical protein